MFGLALVIPGGFKGAMKTNYGVNLKELALGNSLKSISAPIIIYFLCGKNVRNIEKYCVMHFRTDIIKEKRN